MKLIKIFYVFSCNQILGGKKLVGLFFVGDKHESMHTYTRKVFKSVWSIYFLWNIETVILVTKILQPKFIESSFWVLEFRSWSQKQVHAS